MTKTLPPVVVAMMIFSFGSKASCQQWQHPQTARTANLPPVPNQWVTSHDGRQPILSGNYSHGPYAERFSDASGWPSQAISGPVPNQDPRRIISAPNSAQIFNSDFEMMGQPMPSDADNRSAAFSGDRPGSYGTRSWEEYGAGPYVMGDIFSVGRSDYCDEWANHCDCLELTNSRSNCGCTNPFRSKSEPCRHGYRANQASCDGCQAANGSCQDCARSAKRSSVSEYFHPR